MEFCLSRRLGLETRSAHVASRLDPGITSGAVLNARAKTMTSLTIVTPTSARVGAPTRCVPTPCPSYCPSPTAKSIGTLYPVLHPNGADGVPAHLRLQTCVEDPA